MKVSEYMPGEIWIGGKVAASLVADLCATISQQGVALDWGDCDFTPATAEDLLEAAKPNKEGVPLLWLCNSRARWGEFAILERFLEENLIAYTRFSPGRQGCDHEKVEFRPPAGRVEMICDSLGEPMVPAARVRTVEPILAGAVESARDGAVGTTVRLIQSARRSLQENLPGEMPPLEPFEIVASLPRRRRPEKAPF